MTPSERSGPLPCFEYVHRTRGVRISSLCTASTTQRSSPRKNNSRGITPEDGCQSRLIQIRQFNTARRSWRPIEASYGCNGHPNLRRAGLARRVRRAHMRRRDACGLQQQACWVVWVARQLVATPVDLIENVTLTNELNIINNHWTKIMKIKYTFLARNVINMHLNALTTPIPLLWSVYSAFIEVPKVYALIECTLRLNWKSRILCVKTSIVCCFFECRLYTTKIKINQ